MIVWTFLYIMGAINFKCHSHIAIITINYILGPNIEVRSLLVFKPAPKSVHFSPHSLLHLP